MRTVLDGGKGVGVAAPHPVLPVVWAWCYLGVVVAVGVLALADLDPALTAAASAVVVVGTLAASEWGIRRNHPARQEPWRFLQAGVVAAAAAAALRSGNENLAPGATPVADVVSLVAYAFIAVWLAHLLRARSSEATKGALADGLLVGLAAFLVVWVLLISPTLAASGSPLWARVLAGVFPVIDAVLIFVVLRLAFVTPASVPAARLILLMLLLTLVGDLGYSVGAARILHIDTQVLDGMYVLVYGLVGVTTLHPSMRLISDPGLPPASALPRSRIALLWLSLAAPAVLVVAQPLQRPADRAVVAIGILALGGVVLWRAARAVRQAAESERRLAQQATHDPLTGLPNRMRLNDYLAGALERGRSQGRSVAVLFCDLDSFKLVNDSWGHSIGDELLLAVGRRLRAVQDQAGIVGRVGGDEFVLVADGRDAVGDATVLADAVLAQLREPFVLSIGEVFMTASIGIASCNGHLPHPTPEDLIRDADTAMYRAKGEGRNRWARFDAGMRSVVRERLAMQVAMRRALERGEFRVHYQPIVRMADSRVLGFEALVRWASPDLGLVSPARFIPMIEDSDLIVDVGAHVLSTAARQIATWRGELPAGKDLRMSVNVSARQLRDPGFLDQVRAELIDCSLPADALILEITESTMVEDTDATRVKLAALRELGVGLSVDDFGTGYSSLRYLKSFPVTRVKIDRGFVDGLGVDPDDDVIVDAVLAMAAALGLSVVAEGVETPRQRDRLLTLGCDAAQGYLYAGAGPAASVAASLTTDGTIPAVSAKVTA